MSGVRALSRRSDVVGAVLVALIALPVTGATAQSAAAGASTVGASPAPKAAAADPSAAPPGGQRVGTGSERAVIVRSSYGVPSIYGRTMQGVWFGAGYAQAEDRLVQLELTRRTVEGTLSGLAGSSELSQDEDVRTFFYTPSELRAQFRSLPPQYREALEAFSDGINAYVTRAYASPATEKKLVPYEYFELGMLDGLTGPYRPAPWKPTDTIAVGNYLAREFGGGGGSELQNLMFLRYLQAELTKKGDANAPTDALAVFNDARWINDPSAPTTVPSRRAKDATPGVASHVSAASAGRRATPQEATTGEQSVSDLSWVTNQALDQADTTLQHDRQQILQTGIDFDVLSHGGSNAIAVAPSRSKSHKALLWGAPQEGFGNPSIDGEEYLHGPGYDAGGMDITGEPFILIGRNADIAWTTTSEELVDERVYVEHVNFSTKPPTYLYDGKWIPMQAIHEKIPVAGSSPHPFTVYRTVDGPVFSTDKLTGTAFSMRFASWGRETGSLLGFAELGGDHNLAQFRHSMSLVTTLHNFLYADRRGNIAYFGDGLVPIQPSFSRVDPRLPADGDGTQQWKGNVPFDQMPHSINPAQGFLDNWNTKPSQRFYYQQNSGDEYWGTIFRSERITQMLRDDHQVTLTYLEDIEHDIGTIDNEDNTRPAAPYFIPFLERAYHQLVKRHSPLVSPSTHPDLAEAVHVLATWNDHTTIGSSAMSIFMNFLEAFERNTFEGGTFSGEKYTGSVNLSDASLGMGTYGGLGNYGTYNFLYHALAHTSGLVPCDTLCYGGSYFGNHRDQLLVESLNDAITILSGTGTQLGQDVPGFGTTQISRWGYRPAQDTNWDDLDPLAIGVNAHCGTSASQNRSTYMQAIEMNDRVIGRNVLPPGQSAFISSSGVVSPHMCDQVGLFNRFRYKAMPPANP
jgi:penicillin G amidase